MDFQMCHSHSQTNKWTDLKKLLLTQMEAKRIEENRIKDLQNKEDNEEIDDDNDENGDDENGDDENGDDENGDDENGDDENGDNVNGDNVNADDENGDNLQLSMDNAYIFNANEDEGMNDDDENENESHDDDNSDDDDDISDIIDDADEEEENENGVSNCFIDDEAIDDDEDDDNGNECNEENDDHLTNDDEENDANDDKNASFATVSSLNESFQRIYATQNVSLSPYNTQMKYKKRLSDISIANTKEILFNENEFNSQELLNLCSGVFDAPHDDDFEDDDFGVKIKRKQKFNVESDNDDENDDVIDAKSEPLYEDEVLTQRSSKDDDALDNDDNDDAQSEYNEQSDDEESEEQNEDFEIEIEKHKKQFIEDEAELSGSDVSTDEDEDGDGHDEYDDDNAEHEELPSESELRDQIGRIHNKYLLDEDKRDILDLQDKLFEDGDMHDDGHKRQQNFRWNNNNTQVQDEYLNGFDSDTGDEFYKEDEHVKAPALKIQYEDDDDDDDDTKNAEKLLLKSKNVDESFPKNSVAMRSNDTSIKSNFLNDFIVRDERLKNILSTKRSSPVRKKLKKNKIAKQTHSRKSNSISIFDLMETQ